MIEIGILGSSGRMGKLLCQLISEDDSKQARLGPTVSEGNPLHPLLASDVVIDFSQPKALVELANLALQSSSNGKDDAQGKLPAFVIGTTGWDLDARRKIEALAEKTPVLLSSNFSMGVQALLHVLKSHSKMLLDLGYTPVIVETHHRHKKDSPSGTALSLQRAISNSSPGNVQTHSVRAGEVIGQHEITFHGASDHLVLSHTADDRSIFAKGAIEVALWIEKYRREPRPDKKNILSMETFFNHRYGTRSPRS